MKLDNIKELMLEFVDKGITFMFSKSGLPDDYNMHLAKMVEHFDNRCLRLEFDLKEECIYQRADEKFSAREFYALDSFREYVYNYFSIPPHQ